MPIRKCRTKTGKAGWQWGSGKCFRSKKKAIKQMKAIYASGYKGK